MEIGNGHRIGIGKRELDPIQHPGYLSGQGRGPHIHVPAAKCREVIRRGIAKAAQGILDRNQLGKEDVIPFAARARSDGKGRREPRPHMGREALRDRIGQGRTTNDALDRMQYLEMAEVGKATGFGVLDAEAEKRLQVLITHERSPIKTLSTWRVGQMPQPAHVERVQSAVVSPASARRYSRWRNPRETPGLTCSQGSTVSRS